MSGVTPAATIRTDGGVYYRAADLFAAARRISERAAAAYPPRVVALDRDGVAALFGEVHTARAEIVSTNCPDGDLTGGGAGSGETKPASPSQE